MCFIYELITVFIEYWFDNLSWDGQKAIIDLCDFKDEEFAHYYIYFFIKYLGQLVRISINFINSKINDYISF
jgi:hypothetical protein